MPRNPRQSKSLTPGLVANFNVYFIAGKPVVAAQLWEPSSRAYVSQVLPLNKHTLEKLAAAMRKKGASRGLAKVLGAMK